MTDAVVLELLGRRPLLMISAGGMAISHLVLGLLRGKLHHRAWRLALPVAFAVSGAALLIHEQNGWLFARAAFLHHILGWTALVGAIFPLVAIARPRSRVWGSGLALTLVVIAVFLYADRDVAPIFGHLSPLAGEAHR